MPLPAMVSGRGLPLSWMGASVVIVVIVVIVVVVVLVNVGSHHRQILGRFDITPLHCSMPTKRVRSMEALILALVTMTSNFRIPHESFILWLELKKEQISTVLSLVLF
jgi:hypothetical protein